eukprot:1313578-Rhodomonas_salina.2
MHRLLLTQATRLPGGDAGVDVAGGDAGGRRARVWVAHLFLCRRWSAACGVVCGCCAVYGAAMCYEVCGAAVLC